MAKKVIVTKHYSGQLAKARKEALDNERKNYELELKNKDLVIENLKKDNEIAQLKMQLEMQKMSNEVRQLREQAENKAVPTVSEIDKLNETHKQEITDLKEAYQKQIDEMKAEFEKQLQEQKEQFQKMLDNLNNNKSNNSPEKDKKVTPKKKISKATKENKKATKENKKEETPEQRKQQAKEKFNNKVNDKNFDQEAEKKNIENANTYQYFIDNGYKTRDEIDADLLVKDSWEEMNDIQADAIQQIESYVSNVSDNELEEINNLLSGKETKENNEDSIKTLEEYFPDGFDLSDTIEI